MYILDIGVFGLVFNEEFIVELDGYIVYFCLEEIQVGICFVNYFVLGKWDLRSFDVILINLDYLDDMYGQFIVGFIGFEFFWDYILLINYQCC